MEQFLSLAFHGLVIGILISAPMGPIGVLVIQRTLNKGRRPAFLTGCGAALSDLTYSLLTGLGLSFVHDFIEQNQAVLQIVGSLFIVAYALFLFRKNPSRTLKTPDVASSNDWKDFATGFIFTFSNPLILFFIIGLFARFNFLDNATSALHYATGYLAIAAGALGWWFVITYFVNKVRSHFNLRAMWIVNRVVATLLMLMAAAGLWFGINAYFNG
ncbi:MAG: LysE family transporter [Clostridium sp.]|nr:LysE family transporter [Clostridium sp.]